MTEKRLSRTRATLPAGYQFRDAAHEHDYRARYDIATNDYRAICASCGHDGGEVQMDGRFRTLRGYGLVKADFLSIEGERFYSDADHHRTTEGEPV